MFDSVFHLTEEGWRKLTIRWAVFFLVLAVLNEIVWRTQTTDIWVSFKLFGFVPNDLPLRLAAIAVDEKYAARQGKVTLGSHLMTSL